MKSKGQELAGFALEEEKAFIFIFEDVSVGTVQKRTATNLKRKTCSATNTGWMKK